MEIGIIGTFRAFKAFYVFEIRLMLTGTAKKGLFSSENRAITLFLLYPAGGMS